MFKHSHLLTTLDFSTKAISKFEKNKDEYLAEERKVPDFARAEKSIAA